MLTVKNIEKSYGSTPILDGISFSLGGSEKIALVGPNGVGKTSLLKIIAGLVEPDAGDVEMSRDMFIGYLPQQIPSSEETVIKYLERFTGISELEKAINTLDQTPSPETLRHSEIYQEYLRLGGYSFNHRVEVLLEGFGLDPKVTNYPLSKLSGGQKSKVGLTGVLLKGVDLLLLDEPTNNLDLPALQWLEYFVRETTASAIIVSHDRHFLDRTVTRVVEIDWFTRKAQDYPGTYSEYLAFKNHSIERQKEKHKKQQEEIKRLTKAARTKKESAKRGASFKGSDKDKSLVGFKRERAGKSGNVAKAIEKRIEQMEKVEKPLERGDFSIPLRPTEAQAKHRITLNNIVVRRDKRFVLGPLSLDIRYGSRVGILGPNGSGKTTLLKVITGELKPTHGDTHIGPSLVIGNVTQEQENLPLKTTVLNFLKNDGGASEQEAYHLLDRFGFEEREGGRKIEVLSIGGRIRLLFALFSARSANVLVLDEPTNHLDIEGIAALEKMLDTYSGTIILVSHDRHLLESVDLSHVYEMKDGHLRTSSIDDYNPQPLENKMRRLMQRFNLH